MLCCVVCGCRLEYAALCSEGEEGAKVTLEVRESNERALRFYLLHGFVQVATRCNYYPDSEDAILMDRTIRPPDNPRPPGQ